MYCYRFPDEATFITSCEALGWASEGVLSAYTHDRAIDVLGPVQTTPGTYDEEGVELTPPVIDARHHINFQGEAPEEWDEYLVVANSPSRIWAGRPGAVPSTDVLQLTDLLHPYVRAINKHSHVETQALERRGSR